MSTRTDRLFFGPNLDKRLRSKPKSTQWTIHWFSNFKFRNNLLVIASALLGLAPAQAEPFFETPYEAPHMAHLKSYVQAALINNPGLSGKAFDLEAEQAFLDSLKAQYKPQMSFKARVSVSEGGRTIDFPAGDLLNPVYNALNDQAQAQGNGRPFPNVENQSIPLLREFEQDTRLVVRGPLYAPKLDSQVNAQRENVQANAAARDLFRENLSRDVQVAYWQVVQAQAQVSVLQTSLQTLIENERVNQALYEVGQVTLDAPKRAQAERLSLEVTLDRAQLQLSLAKQFFNLLRNAPEQAPIELPEHTALLAESQAIQAHLLPQPNTGKSSTALAQINNGLDALQNLTLAAKAARKPEVGYQVEAGYQGESYSGGPNTGFATASVVLNWNLWDFGKTSAEISQARAQLKSAQDQKTETVRQLHLAKNRAQQSLLIALQAIDAREQAAKAAAESFRISERKRDAGEISQVEFLSAEQLNSRAQIAWIDALCQAHIEHANWQLNNHDLPPINASRGGRP